MNTKLNRFIRRSCAWIDLRRRGMNLHELVREKLCMSIKMLIAAAAAAFCVAGAPLAFAADLDDRYSAAPPDDDPRYGDVYRHPAPPPREYAAPYPGYRETYPPYKSDNAYVPPPPPPPYPAPAYHERSWPPYGRVAQGCLPRHVIKDRLVRQGWHDFDDLVLRGDVAHVRARRPDGYLFDLTVDRCDGRILEASVSGRHEADARRWRYRAPLY
jgi:hypothetical protein